MGSSFPLQEFYLGKLLRYSSYQSTRYMWLVIQILPNKVFFSSFSSPPTSDASVRYICIDDKVRNQNCCSKNNIFLNLNRTCWGSLRSFLPRLRSCQSLRSSSIHSTYSFTSGGLSLTTHPICPFWVITPSYHSIQNGKRRIVAYTNAIDTNRVNGAFLMAGYLVSTFIHSLPLIFQCLDDLSRDESRSGISESRSGSASFIYWFPRCCNGSIHIRSPYTRCTQRTWTGKKEEKRWSLILTLHRGLSLSFCEVV